MKPQMKKQNEETRSARMVQAVLVMGLLILIGLGLQSILSWHNGPYYQTKIGCEWADNTEDAYCQEEYTSNLTNARYFVLKSQTQEQTRMRQREQENAARATEALCWENASTTTERFDIIKDYNISCEQLKYYNDHFVDNYESRESGSISGSQRGLFSYGSFSGSSQQWINIHVSATGDLLKNQTTLTACDGRNQTTQEYYTTANLISYYANKCIGEQL